MFRCTFWARLFTIRVRVLLQFLGASYQETRTYFPAVLGVSFQETLKCFSAVFGCVFSSNVDVFFRRFETRIFKKRGRVLPQILGAYFKKRARVLPSFLGTSFQEAHLSLSAEFWRRVLSRNARILQHFPARYRSSCYNAIFWLRPLKTRAGARSC